ncbi:Peptidyl-prolyl cis-trans isomerase cyp6 [Phlyctochytrium bullatum]|nr:Peptidyl-prolyl cis-trans isomerase cyp6 [Phlyctochytrium bullatum]
MSVLIETSLGDIVIDLYVKKAPRACTNFLKLCKLKYYNFSLFHTVVKNFTAQVGGDFKGTRSSGDSVWGVISKTPSLFPPEIHPKLKHNKKGIVSFATISYATTTSKSSDGFDIATGMALAGSQFFFTLVDDTLDYLDGKHAVFGHVVEGLEVLDAFNLQQTDDDGRPYRDLRIKHTVILDDPFPDPPGLIAPSRSPSPSAEMLKSLRLGEDEELFPDVDPDVLEKEHRAKEAAARALTLEMIGDLPFAEIKPPENVLFVCKLNPITRDEDLELIFSRFGEILSCEIVRDKKTNESLSYAFIEFSKKEEAEEAYFKMDNVLIDDRRIHVDFSQSVSKLHKDFMMGKRRKPGDEDFGNGLQKRTQYRDSSRAEDFDLVFDHYEDLDKEKKRKPSDHNDSKRDKRQRDDAYESKKTEGKVLGKAPQVDTQITERKDREIMRKIREVDGTMSDVEIIGSPPMVVMRIFGTGTASAIADIHIVGMKRDRLEDSNIYIILRKQQQFNDEDCKQKHRVIEAFIQITKIGP